MFNFFKNISAFLFSIFFINSLSSQELRKENLTNIDIHTIPIHIVMDEDFNPLVSSENLLAMVKKYWSFNENIKVVKAKDFSKKAAKKSHSILAYLESSEKKGFTSTGSPIPGQGNMNWTSITTQLVLSIKGKNIAKVYLAETGEDHIAYALKLINYMVLNKDKFSKKWIGQESIYQQANQIKSKTLLIPNEFREKLDNNELKKLYPYKIKFVRRKFIWEKILESSPDYLAIYTVHKPWANEKSISYKVLFSTEDSAIVGVSSVKGSLERPGAIAQLFINKESFKDFVKPVK